MIQWPWLFILLKIQMNLTLYGAQLEWSKLTKVGEIDFFEVLELKENVLMGFIDGVHSFVDRRTNLKKLKGFELQLCGLKQLVLISFGSFKQYQNAWLMYSTFKDMKLENTTRAIRSAKENRGEEDGTRANSSIDLKLSMVLLIFYQCSNTQVCFFPHVWK